MTLSGKFCRNRILFGGRYSSGIWTAGRFDCGNAAPPSTVKRRKKGGDKRGVRLVKPKRGG